MNNWFNNTSSFNDVPEGNLYKPWRLRILPQKEFDELTNYEKLSYLTCFGVLAPTSHNTVPERFQIHKDALQLGLYIDNRFALAESDPTGRQAIISMGCVMSNIKIAAHHYGYDGSARIHKYTQKKRYSEIATLTFAQSKKEAPTTTIETMVQRKVLRAKFDRTVKFDVTLQKKITSLFSKKFPGLGLHIITDDGMLHMLGKYHEDAYKIVFEDAKFTYELGEWLLTNDDKKLPYGMRGKEFGFDNTFAKKVHNGLLRKSKLLPDEIAGFARGVRLTIENSSATVIISAEKEDEETLLSVGEAYEEISLLCLQEGFYNAVNAGAVEVEWAGNIIAASLLNTTQKPLMVFSIGKPQNQEDLKRPHSARPMFDALQI